VARRDHLLLLLLLLRLIIGFWARQLCAIFRQAFLDRP